MKRPLVARIASIMLLLAAPSVLAGSSPLHTAIEKNDTDKALQLVAKKKNIDAADKKTGYTPLALAAQHGLTTVARALIEAGVDPDARTVNGTSPLSLAARHDHDEIVATLLERGADVNAANDVGVTPLLFATFHDHREIMDLLIAGGADLDLARTGGETAMIVAGRNGETDLVRALLEAGADPSARDGWGCTALTYAAAACNTEWMDLLLDLKVDADATCDTGTFPLYEAALVGCDKVVDRLLAYGADVNHLPRNRWPAVYAAGIAGNLSIAKKLLSAGADPFEAGLTIADVAASGNVMRAVAEWHEGREEWTRAAEAWRSSLEHFERTTRILELKAKSFARRQTLTMVMGATADALANAQAEMQSPRMAEMRETLKMLHRTTGVTRDIGWPFYWTWFNARLSATSNRYTRLARGSRKSEALSRMKVECYAGASTDEQRTACNEGVRP